MATDFAYVSSAQGVVPRPLWDVHDLAAFLVKSTSWVYQGVEADWIPHIRVGGEIRFIPQVIIAWVKAGCPRTWTNS